MSRKNLRDAVDDVFRQTSPPTQAHVVQDVLSSEESAPNDSATSLAPALLLTRQQPEASLSLPAPHVTPVVATPISSAAATRDSNGVWSVVGTILIIVLAALLVWKLYAPFVAWVSGGGSAADLAMTAASSGTASALGDSGTTAATITSAALPAADAKTTPQAPTSTLNAAPTTVLQPMSAPMAPGNVAPKKTVRFDESKNTEQYVDGAGQQENAVTSSGDNDSKKDLLRKLEISLDALEKTSLEMQADRDAAIAASGQKEKGVLLRLDERNQFSRTECIADVPAETDEARNDVQTIYQRVGSNNVVGNGTRAPFLTFAPGEEPFDGMIPDYDEKVHGPLKAAQPPPLLAGQPHSMMELITDHCTRTGKPAPKPADKSNLDVHSKKDAVGSILPLRTADCDGHYLESQKKQFELQRQNSHAIKKIYEAKHLSATGQILDKGGTTLSQFAGAHDRDAVQYLNVHSV
jgi:hypothetical protein